MLLASTKVVVKKLIKAALKIDNCEFKCHWKHLNYKKKKNRQNPCDKFPLISK